MSLIIKCVNVGPNLAKNKPGVNNAASVYDYMGQQHLNSMFINPVNEAEVIRIIKLCKPKDSMDYDDISILVQALYDMTSHKLQQKLFYLFCTPEGTLFDM